MIFKHLLLSFVSFFSNSSLWTKENKEQFIYFAERATFTMKREDEDDILEFINDKIRWLLESKQFFHPFFHTTADQNPFIPLLIFFNFSQKLAEKYKRFSAHSEFFTINFEQSNLVKYLFYHNRRQMFELSYNDKRNLKILKSIRKKDFATFLHFYENFPQRMQFIVIIATLTFQKEGELYHILKLSTDPEIDYLKQIFQCDYDLIEKINLICLSKFSEVKNYFEKSEFKLASTALKTLIHSTTPEYKEIHLDSFDSSSESEFESESESEFFQSDLFRK